MLNVGAGAGSYEPTDRAVVAVEPSQRMIDQRPPEASRIVVRAFASELPFDDDAFDAAMALLTVHHWPDASAGLREVRRVTAGPVVVFTFDYGVHADQWLVTEYLPAMLEFDRDVPSPVDDRGRAGRRRGIGRPSAGRLPRRLLPRVVAAARRLPRRWGPRRHLGHRSATDRRRGRGNGAPRRGSRVGSLARHPREPAHRVRDRRGLPARGVAREPLTRVGSSLR